MKKLTLLLIIISFAKLYGQTTFDHTFGIFGPDQGEVGQDLLELDDCNYIVLGGGNDGTFLRKVDEFGTHIWTRQYEFPNINEAYYAHSLVQTSDNGFLIAGSYGSSGTSNSKLLVQKVDEAGNCIWQKSFNDNYSFNKTTIIETQDGNYVIAGYTSSNTAFITKIDPNGNWIFGKSLSTIGFQLSDIVEMSNGNLAFTGGFSYSGQYGICLVITNASGGLLHEKYFLDNIGQTTGPAIIETNDNGLAITGYRGGNNSRGFLIKTDAVGTFSWGKEYLGPNQSFVGTDLIQNADNSYTITGSSNFPAEIALLKTDASGNVIMGKNYTATNFVAETQIIKTQDGGYAIAGTQDGYGFRLASKNAQKKTALVPTRDNIRLIKTDINGDIGGCEIPTTYTQNNYAPTQIALSSTVNAFTVTPQNTSLNCTTPNLDEDISCISGVPICDYTGIDLSETYSCKVDLTNDDSSYDRAFDQVIMPNGNRMITGISYSEDNSQSIFLKELDAVGNLVRLNAYPIQGNISNVELVFDEDANEFVLFFDTSSGLIIDIYLLRVDGTTLDPILRHGPLMSDDLSASFSFEYAIEILYEPSSLLYPSGSYVLLVNRVIPSIRKSYIVTIDKSDYNSSNIEELVINGTSENIRAFDIIKNPFINSTWDCLISEYVITGSFNDDAFISNYCLQGLISSTYDIDNNPSTTDIGKKIIAAGNSYYIAGEITYGETLNVNGNTWLAEIAPVESSPGHQLNGVTIYDENNIRPETIIDLDYNGGYLYLTGEYNISPIGNDPMYNYISKLDLNRNRIWDKEYLDTYNQGTKVITDIEVGDGAINGIGNLYYNPITSPSNNSDHDIYISKTDLNGALSDMTCVSPVIFTNIIANPTINFYNDFVNSSLENITNDLATEVALGFDKECCSSATSNPNICLAFDRTSNSLATASPTILNSINTQDFTFEAWISGDEADQNTHPTIFSNRVGNTGTIFFLHNAWPSTGTFKLLAVQFGQVNYFVVDNGTYNQSLLDGNCHHVAITREGDILTFFIDGEIIGSTIINTTNFDLSSNANLTIGHDFLIQNSFNGSISDMRIWSTARTPLEIQNNMISQLTGNEPNLAANWLMDEGSGQILDDNSTNGNNATLGYNTNIESIDPIWDASCCEMNSCPPIIINNDVPILDGTYQAAQTVESAGTVPATGDVKFKAGQNITLNNDFTVAVDANFSASIEPCYYDLIMDGDGNIYEYVTIGTQEWLTTDLRTTKCNDGTPIPLVTDNVVWDGLSTPAYSWYNNDMTTQIANGYSALYNWYAVESSYCNICPTGWHVPTYAEWTILEDYLGGSSVAGGKMKETGLTHWNNPNQDATNESGWSGLPTGYRRISDANLGNYGYWWSSTEYGSQAWQCFLYFNSSYSTQNIGAKKFGHSVRCLRD